VTLAAHAAACVCMASANPEAARSGRSSVVNSNVAVGWGRKKATSSKQRLGPLERTRPVPTRRMASGLTLMLEPSWRRSGHVGGLRTSTQYMNALIIQPVVFVTSVLG